MQQYKRLGLSLVGIILLAACGGSINSDNEDETDNNRLVIVYDRNTNDTSNISAIQQKIIDSHNAKRHQYYRDADLSYSHDLETAAQEYANVLAQNGTFVHDPMNQERGYGENLYAHSANYVPEINDVLTSWFDDEEPYYEYEDRSCQKGTFPNGQPIMCGHYTQVLWQQTNEVGCASAQYQAGEFTNGYVYVCKYQKPGNVVVEKPYCLEYSNSDLYTQKIPSFLNLTLANKRFPIELIVEDRTQCTRTSNFNSAISFGENLSSVKIEDFKIFNTENALNTLVFNKMVVSDETITLTGKNKHINDENYRDKDIYMKITLTGETDTYYGVELDWNGYDADQAAYSRQMKAKLYK